MADESTPLRKTVIVNDDVYPPAYYSPCREIIGGFFQILITIPLCIILCIIISPFIIYWIIQIFCKLDPRGVKNGQNAAHAPRVDEEINPNTHIGTVKILFVIPDGGYDPAEVSIMYNTLKSYQKYETDEVRIIFATPSGSIDTMNINKSSGDNNTDNDTSDDNTTVEVYAYGSDPLFRSSFGFGLFYSPFINTYYRDMLESVDWYNSRYKNNPDNSYKEIISFEEIETEDISEIYDGIFISGGHHWNFNKLFKSRILHYKLSKLWQLSLDHASGMNDPIQFAAIGRGVAVLAYSLYTHFDDNMNQEEQDIENIQNLLETTIDIDHGHDYEDEIKREIELRKASRYDSDTDSGDDIPSMLPSATNTFEISINNEKNSDSDSDSDSDENNNNNNNNNNRLSSRISGLMKSNQSGKNSKATKKAREKMKQNRMKKHARYAVASPRTAARAAAIPEESVSKNNIHGGNNGGDTGSTKNRRKYRANLRSILYHTSVTTLPAWCEFLGNFMANMQYGQIFSAANPHMKSCAEIVEQAVGDNDEEIKFVAEKKFYHMGPHNWLVWFFQGLYDYCTKNDYRLTYVIEDSHIVTGRWFIDTHLVAKRFMAKMVEQ